MAHPLGGDVGGNIKRALRWLAWLRRSFPTVTFIAPWIAGVLSGEDDADPSQREAGLVDCETVASRCDGVVLVGGRISSGMAREREAAKRSADLTAFGVEAPADLYTFALHGPVSDLLASPSLDEVRMLDGEPSRQVVALVDTWPPRST